MPHRHNTHRSDHIPKIAHHSMRRLIWTSLRQPPRFAAHSWRKSLRLLASHRADRSFHAPTPFVTPDLASRDSRQIGKALRLESLTPQKEDFAANGIFAPRLCLPFRTPEFGVRLPVGKHRMIAWVWFVYRLATTG